MMTENTAENNQVTIVGMVTKKFEFSHEAYGEEFYRTVIRVKRLSDSEDELPVLVSERLMDTGRDYRGQWIEVKGQFRSRNRHEKDHNYLVLCIFAREVKMIGEGWEMEGVNQIFLDGYVCREPVYRRTPYGREIADVLLAVNRTYGKSDYIPCICWGRNARYATSFAIGARVMVWGRIQSRIYLKKIDETHAEKKIAYEISVNKLDHLE